MRHRRAAVFGGLAAIVAAAILINPPHPTVVSVPATGPSTLEVRGFLTVTPGPDGTGVLISTSETVDGTEHARCWGQSQYRDIGYGTPVTVYDDQDAPVATGHLGPGRTAEVGVVAKGAATCLFPIVVTRVPVDSGFYQVGVPQQPTVMVENAPENGILFAFITLGADNTVGTSPQGG